MKNLLQIIDLHFAYQSEPLFAGLNLLINRNDKIGLIGHNGCGKSTLLSLINSQHSIDSGEIRKPHNIKIATVEQFIPDQIKTLSMTDALLHDYPAEQKASELWRTQRLLTALGFNSEDNEIPVDHLSGGQQNLLLIAKAQLQEPDLLLLDEPGNHMDILAMAKLEQYLSTEIHCAFMIISHDRHLLNNACNKTLFIRDKSCQKFELPFDQARKLLAEQDKQAEQRLADEQKEITRLQSSAKRLAIIGRENDNAKLAKKAKSMQKKISKLECDKTQLTSQSKLKLTINEHSSSSPIKAKQLIEISNLQIYKGNQSLTNQLLLNIDQFIIKPADRIAILGINGVGKTTLLQAIKHGYQQQSSNISQGLKFNPRVTLGYYDQELSLLDSTLSRIDWLRSQTDACEAQMKQSLINSGIKYTEFDRPVNQLSGGEKSRMMFLMLALKNTNLMILDEPTNHIDLEGKDQLIKQLTNTKATLLITSHDRAFLDTVANRFVLITNNELRELSNSNDFYEHLISSSFSSPVQNDIKANTKPMSSENIYNQEALLERIEYLEQKISLEEKQNPKRQKKLLLHQWQQELTLLWQKI